MKQKIAVFILGFAFLGCATNSISANNDVKIKHFVKFTNKGTRSEARHGFLEFEGKKIPDVFTFVKIEKTVYRFYQRRNRWGADGYHSNRLSDLKIKKSSNKIKSKFLKAGYYKGDKKLKGTPKSWIYVKWQGGSAFVAPAKIYRLIKDLKLKRVSRLKGFDKQLLVPKN